MTSTSTATPGFAETPRTWLMLGGFGFLLLLLARNPAAVLAPQFWHEDAIVFLVEQRTLGPASIFEPFGGYLNLFPRIVAVIAGLFPLEWTPAIYLVGAMAAWSATTWLVLTSPLFRSTRWGAAAACAWIAVPHGGEVFTNLTNSQWPLAAGLALLLAEGKRTHGRDAQLLFVAVASLTGPSCVLLLPIACWRAWETRSRDRRIDLVALMVLVVGIVQASCLLGTTHREIGLPSARMVRFAAYPFIEFFPELFGTKAGFPRDLPLRLLGLGLGAATLAAVIRGPAAKAPRILLTAGLLMLLGGVALYLAELGGVPRPFEDGQRYLIVPYAAYVWAILATLPDARRAAPWIRAVLLLSLAGMLANSGRQFVAPATPPTYDWSVVCSELRTGRSVTIHVPPFGAAVVIPP